MAKRKDTITSLSTNHIGHDKFNLNQLILYFEKAITTHKESNVGLQRLAFQLGTSVLAYAVIRHHHTELPPLIKTKIQKNAQYLEYLIACFEHAYHKWPILKIIFDTTNVEPIKNTRMPNLQLIVEEFTATIENYLGKFVESQTLGDIYENLINQAEQSRYGQFYTSDQITSFISFKTSN